MPEKTPHNQPASETARTVRLEKVPAPGLEGQTIPLEASVSLIQRGMDSSAELPGLRSADVLRLQNVAGNRAVTSLLARRAIQPRLTVGPANDSYEQEADRIARQVMDMPAPVSGDRGGSSLGSIQRKTLPVEEEVQAKPLAASISPIQRAFLRSESELRRAGNGGFAISDDFEGRLNAARSGGAALPDGLRRDFEPRFGADFSGVRLHTGAAAGTLNREIQAKAFTLGGDIFFGDGQYDPHLQPGKELLAHELTHTIQQGASPVRAVRREVTPKEELQTQRLQRQETPEEQPVFPVIPPNSQQREVIRRNGTTPPAPAPAAEAPAPAAEAPAAAATITHQTVATAPGERTRTTIGVGEEVDLTYSGGSIDWTTTGGTLSLAKGSATRFSAPGTGGSVTVNAGTASIAFSVITPSGVWMDRFPGTNIRHTQGRPDSGIQTLPYLMPDTVNFYRVQYHEVDIGAVATGVYQRFNGVGHDAHPATIPMSKTVVPVKGTKSYGKDSVYSGDTGLRPPFAAGSITFSIPYEYKVGNGAFARFATAIQVSVLTASGGLASTKAGATGSTTVESATSAY